MKGLRLLMFLMVTFMHKGDAQTRKEHLEMLVGEGNKLMESYHEQETKVHNIAFRNKEISGQIDKFIEHFSVQDMIQNASQAMDSLKGAEGYFSETQAYIGQLSEKEKELNDLIQKILQSQQQATTESGEIQAELTRTVDSLSATVQQIETTQADLTRLEGEVKDLEARVRQSENDLEDARDNRPGLIFATIFTLGLASPALIANENAVDDAKDARNSRADMLAKTRQHFQELQAAKADNEGKKTNLEQQQNQLQQDQTTIQDILTKLQSALGDTVKYRLFLTSLSDAFKDVKVHIEHMVRNLEQLTAVHAEGVTPPSGIESNLNDAHKGFMETWATAKAKPAIEITLSLGDPNDVTATLNAIKAREWASSSL